MFSLSKWLKATFLGWLAGIVLILILSSGLDAVGIEGMQFYLGIGMGAAVGFMQWRAMKAWTSIDKRWIWYSILGLGIPFLAFDLYSKFGGTSLGSWYLPLSIGVGGIVLGALQAHFLSKYFTNTRMWVLWCCLAWWLAMAVVLGIDYTKYVSSNNWVLFFLNIGLMLGGGVVLGFVSGHFLKRIMKSSILLLTFWVSIGLAKAQNDSGVIDLSNQPAGVYFLRLFDENKLIGMEKVLLTD